MLTYDKGRLCPMDAYTEEVMQNIRNGETVKAKITRPRNLKHHCKFMAMVNRLFKMQTTFGSQEDFLIQVKYWLGRVRMVRLANGTEIPVVESISFAQMDQDRFDAFYQDAEELICGKMFPHMSDEERNQILEIMEGRL
jgi:hypothetical protein